MDTSKFKVKYSKGTFTLSPSAFRLWLILESDSNLRQRSYTELAEAAGLSPKTISRAMPSVADTYKDQQVIGYLPCLLRSAAISNTALKVIAWMWLRANENASNRLYLTNSDIAAAVSVSVETVETVRRELDGRFVATEILTQRHAYVIRKPSQHLLNALAIHTSVTQFTLLNPETGKPVRERKVDTIKCDIRLTNRILERFGLKPLQSLEEPGLRVLPNGNQLFVWHSGGFSLWRAGSRFKSEKGKKQIGQGNIFELYQLLSGCPPEVCSNAIRFLDSTKGLAKEEYVDLAKLDREVLGEARFAEGIQEGDHQIRAQEVTA